MPEHQGKNDSGTRFQLHDRVESVFTLPIDARMSTLGPKQLSNLFDA